jgi:hypothetical protein
VRLWTIPNALEAGGTAPVAQRSLVIRLFGTPARRRGWKTILVMLAFLVAFSGDVAGMRRGYPHRI